jgi:hypothetical protein
MANALQLSDLLSTAQVTGKSNQLWLRALTGTLFVRIQRRNAPSFWIIIASPIAALTISWFRAVLESQAVSLNILGLDKYHWSAFINSCLKTT